MLTGCLLSACGGGTSTTSNTSYSSGNGYELISNPQPVLADGRVHVEEIFWFGCSHCFALEPSLEKWKKTLPNNVAFSKVPASFNTKWASHAQLFYTVEVLGLAATLNSKIFNAIHVDKKPLLDQDTQREFVLANSSVSKQNFDSAYLSSEVQTKMTQAHNRIQAYQITSVPIMVVNGKYLVSVRTAGSQEALFDVLNYLIKK